MSVPFAAKPPPFKVCCNVESAFGRGNGVISVADAQLCDEPLTLTTGLFPAEEA
ncbi:MAG: hypothetical protein U0936_25270 [Planctomycetaceae bacterium]